MREPPGSPGNSGEPHIFYQFGPMESEILTNRQFFFSLWQGPPGDCCCPSQGIECHRQTQDTPADSHRGSLPNPPGKLVSSFLRAGPTRAKESSPPPQSCPPFPKVAKKKSSELLPVPQDKWKEARTKLKSRVACGAEVRYPGLQKETPVWAMLAQGCPGLGTLCPVCVVFEVTPVL